MPNGAPPYQWNTIQTLQEFSSPWKFQKAPKEENWRKACRSSPPWCFFSKRLWWLTKGCLTRGNGASVSEMWFACMMDVTLCPNRSWGVLCFCFFWHIFQSQPYFCSFSYPMYPAARLHMLVQNSVLNAGFLWGHSESELHLAQTIILKNLEPSRFPRRWYFFCVRAETTKLFQAAVGRCCFSGGEGGGKIWENPNKQQEDSGL